MLLIFTENRVTDRMLPWGTPISCGWESEKVDPTWTLKYISCKQIEIKLGRRPLRQKPWRSFIIPYFHVVSSFLQIKEHRNWVLIMDESFPAKRFKSSKMINRATSGSEGTLHISEQFLGFKIPVDHSFHGFTDATCQSNRVIIGRINWILTRLWNRNHNCFPPIRRKVAG